MKNPNALLAAKLLAAETKIQLLETQLVQRDRILLQLYQSLTTGLLDLRILTQQAPGKEG